MVTFFKDAPEEDQDRAQDLSQDGFDGQFIGKSQMMAWINEQASSRGQKLDYEDAEGIFAGIMEKNKARLAAGTSNVMVLDFDDPALVPVNSPTEALAEGLVKGATFNQLDIFPEQGNEDPFSMAAGAYGNFKGMLGGKMGFGKFKGSVPGPVGMMQKAGVPSPLAFGAYGAASPAESGGERIKNAALNTALGVGLEVAPGMITGLASKASPRLGYEVARGMGTKVGKKAYDAGIFYGMGKAQSPGASNWELIPEALGGAAAAGGPRAKTRPAKGKEMPKPPWRRGKATEAEINAAGAEKPYIETVVEEGAKLYDKMKSGAEKTGDKTPDKELFRVAVEKATAQTDKRFDPVEGEPITEPMSRYLRRDASSAELMKGLGKILPKRASKPVRKFIQEGTKDKSLPNMGESQTRGRHQQFEDWGGSTFNNPVARATIRVMEMVDMVKARLDAELKADWLNLLNRHGIQRGDADKRQLMDFMRLYNTGMDAAELAKSPEGIAALSGAKNPGKIVKAAGDIRAEFDRHYEMRDTIMKAVGEKGMKYRQGYYPDMAKRYGWETIKREGWQGLKKVVKQKTEPIKPQKQDPNKFARVSSPRELPQTLKAKDVELDPWKFLDVIASDTAGKIGDTVGLQAAKNVADVFEKAGYHETADGIRAIGEAGYNGKRFGLAGAEIRGLQSTRGGQSLLIAERALKQQFNKAKYTLAIPFIVLRQWGSLGYLTGYGDVTPEMYMQAIARAATPEAGRKYLDSYTGWAKNIERGDIFREGAMGELLSAFTMNPPNKTIQGLRKMTERPVNAMENFTGRVSVEMADLIAEKMNMPQADRQAFRSEVAGRTQSFYDSMNRPELLNSPTMNLFWPAQSFSMTGLNVLRDIQNRKGLTPQQKMAKQSNVVGTIFLASLVHTFTTGYRNDPGSVILDNAAATANSFVPFASSVLGVGPGPADGSVYPANLIKDLGKAMKYAADDDMESAFGEIAKNLIRAGAQMNREIGTSRYIDRGVLDEDDRFLGSALGWYTPTHGKEYLADIKGTGKKFKPWEPPAQRRSKSRSTSNRSRRR